MGKYRPKKTMVAHRKFSEGSDGEPVWKKELRESAERLQAQEKAKFAPPKVEQPSYWGEVKNRVNELRGKTRTPPAPAVADVMQDEGRRMSEASGFKKGGKVKPRGVGIAQRGHGRAR